MQEILINDDLLTKILKGEKTTTCRKGIRNYKFEHTIMKSNSTDRFAIIDITGLELHKLKDITDDIARADGFINRDNLVKVMESIYPGISADDDITIVYFKLVKNPEM